MTPMKKSSFAGHPKKERITRPDWPVWYLPEAPLGAAVRYLAALSAKFHWVGIYILKGDFLELGPYIGAATPHTRIPVGKGICGTAISENRDLNIPRVNEEPNYLACSIETRSELVVLIRDKKGQVVGQIDIDSHFENAFGSEEENHVQRVARELGEIWPG